MSLTRWIDEFRHDVLFALRQMRATPAFTFVAALTLALGIGANSAIFALVDATLLRPLPFREPDQVVMLSERTPRRRAAAASRRSISSTGTTDSRIADRHRRFRAAAWAAW